MQKFSAEKSHDDILNDTKAIPIAVPQKGSSMSAIGTKRTIQPCPRLSAIGATADKGGFWAAVVYPLMTQSGLLSCPTGLHIDMLLICL
jgi:hypothetical protein